ncbi:hypothetical protein V0R37_12475 [Pollutimonas sp. H1-120]|uniref:hypothetical protein n=1 Tax=Pollutimonas sp. H1-120 TaxID=3148824 RepID=UPI003B52DEA9
MTKQFSTLDDDVLAVFERACNEGELQVAEHLLRALEERADLFKSDDFVERAYLDLARSFDKKLCR